MDCPRCGSFCSVLDAQCSCGYEFPEDAGSSNASAKAAPDAKFDNGRGGEDARGSKKKRKKRRLKKPRLEDTESVSEVMLAQHKLGVIALLLLNSITCGIYGSYWFLMRQPFVDSMHSGTKIGRSVPTLILAGNGINIAISVLSMAMTSSGEALPAIVGVMSQLFSLAVGIASLIIAFKIRGVLLDHGRRLEPGYSVSALATFFFNILYLQYKINRMKTHADIDHIVQEFA